MGDKIARHTVFDMDKACQEEVNKKCPSPSWNWQCFSELLLTLGSVWESAGKEGSWEGTRRTRRTRRIQLEARLPGLHSHHHPASHCQSMLSYSMHLNFWPNCHVLSYFVVYYQIRDILFIISNLNYFSNVWCLRANDLYLMFVDIASISIS